MTGARAILELEITQRISQAHEHTQLLMLDIKAGECGFLVIALLRFDNEAIHGIGRAPDFEREAVLFMLREVIQIDRHQLGEFHEFLVQLGFIVQPHRYRSGLQRYKAARNDTLVPEPPRARLRPNAQTPAYDESLQVPPEVGHISFGL